jgi:hypothetical protein
MMNLKLGGLGNKSTTSSSGTGMKKIGGLGIMLGLDLGNCVRPEFEEKPKIEKPPDKDGETNLV